MRHDIILPPVHNLRSPSQWDIINKHVYFKGKTVIDLGCGYGDILLRCWAAGAKEVIGIDLDISNAQGRMGDRHGVFLRQFDLNEIPVEGRVDIIICFSVLPYLEQPMQVLEWIKNHSEVALIECQYAGDGPPSQQNKLNILNDDDMFRFLNRFDWKSIENIGKTLVEDREIYRTIWRCE